MRFRGVGCEFGGICEFIIAADFVGTNIPAIVEGLILTTRASDGACALIKPSTHSSISKLGAPNVTEADTPSSTSVTLTNVADWEIGLRIDILLFITQPLLIERARTTTPKLTASLSPYASVMLGRSASLLMLQSQDLVTLVVTVFYTT
jgi:hypothetical protein